MIFVGLAILLGMIVVMVAIEVISGFGGKVVETMRVNSGFWDLPGEVRAFYTEKACEKEGVADFNDLPAEVRGEVYEEAARNYYGDEYIE